MRVHSELADIDFGVGSIEKADGQLIIDSDPSSTIATKIILAPHEARATIAKLVSSGAFWRFLFTLPFAGRGETSAERAHQARDENDDWQHRRTQTGINKPW